VVQGVGCPNHCELAEESAGTGENVLRQTRRVLGEKRGKEVEDRGLCQVHRMRKTVRVVDVRPHPATLTASRMQEKGQTRGVT